MEKTALIAGKGEIVLEAIEALKEPLVISLVDEPEYPYHYKFSPGEVGRILKVLKKENVKKVAFFGKIEKKGIFGGYKLDLKALKLLSSLRSFKDDDILNKVVEVLEKEGIEVVDQKEMLSHLIPEPGVICGRLTEDLKRDIAFGFEVAKAVGKFGIGQTVAVKKGTVIAVEAIEGTDETIRRAGSYAKDFVVVKVKRPIQRTLMDLPVVGDRTVFVAKEAGAKAIAVEAGETIVTEQAKEVAGIEKITLVAVEEKEVKKWQE